MSVFLLLALGAAIILLVLEGAWLARLPPEKIYRLILRCVLIAIASAVAWMIATDKLPWIYAPVVVVLPLIDRIYARMRYRGHVESIARASRHVAKNFSKFAKDSRVAFQDTARAKPQNNYKQNTPSTTHNNDMTADKALKLLGLVAGSNAQQIKEAHRRLMRKAHPDRGGSSQLAAQINRAKDVLLREANLKKQA